jgi:hypothetical protein
MKTKEQLISENAALRAQVEKSSSIDSIRRGNFAKVFGRVDNRYGFANEPANLSWDEIFYEVGQLSSLKEFRCRMDNLEFRFDQLKPSPVSVPNDSNTVSP